MYRHTPANSTIVLAADNFPVLETAASWERAPTLALPDDPQAGAVQFAAGNLPSVDHWVESLGSSSPIFLVLSRSMASYSAYYGLPKGYEQLQRSLPSSPDWSVYSREPRRHQPLPVHARRTIQRSAAATVPPTAAAAVPPTMSRPAALRIRPLAVGHLSLTLRAMPIGIVLRR